MNIHTYLAQSGLDEKESKIYLALLQLQQASVLEVSKKSNIKRPTAYVVLDQLEQKGLAIKTQSGKATLYKASSPTQLVEMLNKKRALLERVMPSLLTIYKNEPGVPSIKIKKGIEAVKQVYRELCEGIFGQVFRFGDMYSLHKAFQSEPQYVLEMFKEKDLLLRDLIGSTEFEKKYFSKRIDKNNYEVRFYNAPKEVVSILFNNKVYIFSVGRDPHVMVIDDKSVYQAYMTLSSMAWKSAQKYSGSKEVV